MQRKLAVLLLALAFVLEVCSGNLLKCYMCTSVTNEGCGEDLTSTSLEPMECTIDKMGDWKRSIEQNKLIAPIAGLFEVDRILDYQGMPRDMTCGKMKFIVGGQDVFVRSCQSAKTDDSDPCKSLGTKLSNNMLGRMEYCGLCLKDACNGSSTVSPRFLYTVFPILATFVLGVLFRAA